LVFSDLLVTKVQLFNPKFKIIKFKIDVRVMFLQNENKIKNTRHSSGLGVNAKNISSIEPDECPDDSSGTHQGCYQLIIRKLRANLTSDEYFAF